MAKLHLVKVSQVFSHDGRRHYPGEQVFVEAREFGMFTGMGWASDTGETRDAFDFHAEAAKAPAAEADPVTLEVQDGQHPNRSKI